MPQTFFFFFLLLCVGPSSIKGRTRVWLIRCIEYKFGIVCRKRYYISSGSGLPIVNQKKFRFIIIEIILLNIYNVYALLLLLLRNCSAIPMHRIAILPVTDFRAEGAAPFTRIPQSSFVQRSTCWAWAPPICGGYTIFTVITVFMDNCI